MASCSFSFFPLFCLFVHVYVCADVHMSHCAYGSQETISGVSPLPSALKQGLSVASLCAVYGLIGLLSFGDSSVPASLLAVGMLGLEMCSVPGT